MFCHHCGKETNNPKFCSRSCSASSANSMKPKRNRKEPNCQKCLNPLPTNRRYPLCASCATGKNIELQTLGEVKERAKYQKTSQIRAAARNKYFRNTSNRFCLLCGYEKHIEICHIKAIEAFSDATLVQVINDLKNLVALCPNCHWEFDHGLLTIPLSVSN